MLEINVLIQIGLYQFNWEKTSWCLWYGSFNLVITLLYLFCQ